MEILLSIVGKIGESLVSPIGEQFGYLISYKSSIKILEEKFLKLREKKEAVQQSVVGAEWNQEVVASEVKTWLANVGKKLEEVGKFLGGDAKTNMMCMNGWCPHLVLRYSLGKKAQKNTRAINELLLEEGGKYDRVFNNAPPLKVGSLSTKQFKDFESRKEMIQNVLEALRDEKTDMIAICGMGGIGKTEMAKEIAGRIKNNGLFHEVVIAVVSQSPNLTKIQGELAEMLGPRLDKESLHERANELYSRLTKAKKVLVILDDVWDPLDLEAIGVYHAVKEKSCKILMTSRSEETCSQMRFQKIFPIGLLSEEEAWNLFREMAGDCINTPNLIRIAQQVVKECAGLPLAIAVVGSAPRNKRDEIEWKAALDQLRMSNPQNILGLHPKVYSSIELSYNYLESKDAKSCFLLCCLYPEDYDVPIEHLVRYGVAKRFLKGFSTVEQIRAHVNTIVRNLQRSNLLLDSHKDECIKMHDIVRDVAISIASRDEYGFMVELDKRHEEWPLKDTYDSYTTISLLLGEMEGHPDGLKCPKLQLLRLLCLRDSKTFPGNFFNGMNELKMLSLQEGCFSLTSLPSSIQMLENLRMLNLESCRLGDVSAIGTLGKLEILGFRDSEIEELPREIGNLGQLKLLDMKMCFSLKRIAAGVLSRLSRLQELYMENFKNWEYTTTIEGDGERTSNNASLAELIPYFGRMTVLEISISDIGCLPKEFDFSNSSLRFRINTRDDGRYLFENEIRLEREDASDLGKVLLESRSVFGNLKHCAIVKCQHSKNIFWLAMVRDLVQLKSLDISKCENIEEIFSKKGEDSDVITLPKLEKMHLYSLPRLIGICQSMDSVEVEGGGNTSSTTLTHKLFSSNTILWFPNLVELSVKECELLEVVFDLEGLKVIENSQLQSLELLNLSRMAHVWKNVPRGFQGFQNLISIKIEACPKLRNLLSASVAKLLVKLQTVNVEDCELMENVIQREDEAGKEMGEDITTSFSSKAHSFEWSSIKKIELSECPKLKTFYSSLERNKHDIKKEVTLTKQEEEPNVSSETENQTKMCSLFPYYLIQSLENLEELTANECDSLEVIFELEGLNVEESNYIFNNLTKLTLSYLSKLLHIWKKGPRDIKGFNNLRLLQVSRCHSLKCLFTPSIAKLLVKLEEIQVMDCSEMEEIIGKESGDEEKRDHVIAFPQVKSLCSEAHSFDWPSIKKIQLWNCPKLKTFGSEVQSGRKLRKNDAKLDTRAPQEHSAGSSSTSARESSRLFNRCLELSCIPRCKNYNPDQGNCNSSSGENKHNFNKDQVTLTKLEDEPNVSSETENQTKMCSLFPYYLIQSLENLEELTANECDSLEVIFELEGLNVEESNYIFNNLRVLRLFTLPKLLHIWKKGPRDIKGFNNLRLLQVSRCHSLKCLFTPSIAKLLVKLEEIEVQLCIEMEEIIGKESGDEERRDVIVFPQVNTLSLMDLPKLEFFYTEDNYAFEWPSLEKMTMVGCQHLKMFVSTRMETPKLKGVHYNEFGAFQPMIAGDLNTTIQFIVKGSKVNLVEILQGLSIRSREDLEYLSEALPNDQTVDLADAFYLVQSLELDKYFNLKEIYHTKLLWKISELGNLRSVKLYRCSSLKNVFSLAIAKGLVQLQELTVRVCGNIEEILSLEGDDEKAFDVIKLPKLTNIKLECLPRLICFSQSTAQYSSLNGKEVARPIIESSSISSKLFSSNTILWVPNLEELVVNRLYIHGALFDLKGQDDLRRKNIPVLAQMRTLHLEELFCLAHVWKNIPPGFQGFRNLTSIEILKCQSLRYLFLTYVANLLVKLQSISIVSCKRMESIVQNEEAGEERGLDVENLVSFSIEACSFKWPSITNITLRTCPKLKTLGSKIQSPSKLQKTDAEKDSRAQEPRLASSSKADSPDFLSRCLECVPSSRSSSPVVESSQGSTKRPQEEEQNERESVKQTKIWSLIPTHLIEGLQNLKELEANGCDSLELIFEIEGLDVKESDIFNNLTKLLLISLPKLLHIWKKGPRDIKGFNNLRLLRVMGCSSLKCLFTPSIAKLLVKLEEIEVDYCNEMKEIIGKESGDEEKRDHVIAFPQVKTLKLHYLLKLECFCNEAISFEWPSLENMILDGCEELKMFVSKSMKTPKLKGVHTEYNHESRQSKFQPMIGDLNTTIQHIIKGKANFQEISQSSTSP